MIMQETIQKAKATLENRLNTTNDSSTINFTLLHRYYLIETYTYSFTFSHFSPLSLDSKQWNLISLCKRLIDVNCTRFDNDRN